MPNFYMPTKKRRVGFIPRSDVLDLINKLSFENNLSISKIINILVEEALYKRGIFNIKNGKILNYENKIKFDNENLIKIKNDDKDISNEIYNSENQSDNVPSHKFIDKEIYEKFLMFLQFQEEMKKRN
ncbi:possible (AF143461) BdrC3 [Borrelia hermsii] [Prochlorococcus marinus subsp. pastoris str. CCMP1986]|uniref:Possible (AF143461) BdrC3 [Borrelia hermsii] n=2 Tax=Prochlorococcaceae TaxID=2881426 RepID=Q7V1P6_PROMP|nr:possible (AF143461) BdrC3 [Borrelia hermsii] [Prochlorococcus marinus subsp. pastoris str. CCMP1986]